MQTSHKIAHEMEHMGAIDGAYFVDTEGNLVLSAENAARLLRTLNTVREKQHEIGAYLCLEGKDLYACANTLQAEGWVTECSRSLGGEQAK